MSELRASVIVITGASDDIVAELARQIAMREQAGVAQVLAALGRDASAARQAAKAS